MILWLAVLDQAADIASDATQGDNTFTAMIALAGTVFTTIFGAYAVSQRSQVDILQKTILDCRAGRDKDVEYERGRAKIAEDREDKCLDRLGSFTEPINGLSTAVRENATVGTAIVQEVRNHANRVDTIVRTQETMGRDVADNKRGIDDVKRALDELRYGRPIRERGGNAGS